MSGLTRRQHVPDPELVIEDLLEDLRGEDPAQAYLDAVATLDLEQDDLIEVCIRLGRRLLAAEDEDDT